MNNTSDDSTYYINILQSYFSSYIWVLLAFGVPGNIACIITVSTMTVSTATLYVVILAAADLLALVLKFIFHQLDSYEVVLNIVACKVGVLVEVVSGFANWTLVLICFERFLALCYPLQRNAYFTKKKAMVIAVCLAVALFLCYLYSFIHTQYEEDCQFPDHLGEFFKIYWRWITVVLYFLLPFILLSVFTCLIIVSLCRQRKERERLMATVPTSSADTNRGRVEQTICVMMLCAAIVFLMLTFPTCVYHLILAFDVFKYDTVENLFVWKMTELVSASLSEANHAVNFYVYFLSAKRFRSRCKELIQKCCNISVNVLSNASY